MSDENAYVTPPGICDECIRDNLFRWNEQILTVHCRHRATGAVGIVDGCTIAWHAWRPITRERFEAIATQAAQDATGGGAQH